jgi:hypothetical protein
MNLRLPSVVLGLLVTTFPALPGCTGADDAAPAGGEAAFTSNDHVLEFRFSAEVVTHEHVSARQAVVAQLAYVQGLLTTAHGANGHVGRVELIDVHETVSGGRKSVAYTASLPVIWPKQMEPPSSYELVLPKDSTDLASFDAKYDGSCGKNKYGPGTFWHGWNPRASRCAIAEVDVVRSPAVVTPHAMETNGKYPEYDEIWSDDRLDIVAVFSISQSNTPRDPGYTETAAFLEGARQRLTDAILVDNPKTRSILLDQTLTGKVVVGGRTRAVEIHAILVEELAGVGADFDARYEPISERADLLLYSGHAGLGKNVNALARKGRVAPNKYQLVLMNGCQTFGYLDTALTDRRIEVNGADVDPKGTRYLDVVANALPSYAHNRSRVSLAFVGAALNADAPQHYNEIIAPLPRNHLVAVFGEEDNTFTP